MSEDNWWDTTAELDAKPGLPVKRQPRELDEIDEHRMPSRLSASWIEGQLPDKFWTDFKKVGGKLTAPMIAAMCDDARRGLSRRAIMARAGFHVRTWWAWEKKAADEMQPYVLWYQCLIHSISQVEEELVDNIRMQSTGDWKAAKWLLEQLNRDEYSPTPSAQILNIHGDVKQDNTQSVNYMDQNSAVQVAQLLKQIGALPAGEEETVDAEVVDES